MPRTSFVKILALALLSSTFAWIATPPSAATTTTYSSAFTSNTTPTSTQATDWRNYLLSLTGTYSKITITSSAGGSVSVTDASIVPTIATKLRTSAATGSTVSSYTIGSLVVSVGPCGNDLEISIGPVGGTSTCSCYASGVYTLRPGIGNGNWGGANNQTCSQNSPAQGVSQTLTISFTEDAPSPTTFSTSQTSPTKIATSGNISYSLVLSQSVADLSTGDFQFGGTSTCNTPSLSGSGTTYTVTLTNCSEGNLILQLKANSVTGTTTTGPTSIASANTIIIDRTAPTISSVTGPSNGTYIPGNSLSFTMNFSETVTASGNPRLALTVGSTTRYAGYASGTNTKALTFTYVVQTDSADIDTNGISLSTTLDLNGGAIADLATNALSSLTFTTPTLTSVLVSQKAAAPTITAITPTNGQLSIAFTAGATNGSAITNYKYSLNGAAFISAATTTSPIVITGLTNGTSYAVRLLAVNAAGDGESSTAVTETPTAIVITGDSTLTLTYGTSASTSAYSALGGNNSFTWSLGSAISGVTLSGTTVTAGNTLPAGTYSQSVKANDTSGGVGTKVLTITVNKASTSISIALPNSATTAAASGAFTISATVSQPGLVNFKLGGSSIAGCSSSLASSTTATCSWTAPGTLGNVTLTAEFTPTDSSNYETSTTTNLTITVVNGVSTVTLALAGGVTQTPKGQEVVITATIDQAGKIAFYADGKRIAGCITKVVAAGNRTCSWKPTNQKQVTITVTLNPTNTVYQNSSQSMKVLVTRRTGLR